MRKFIYIGVLGAIGAVLRYVFTDILTLSSGILTSTLLINIVGCFLITFVYMTTLNVFELNSALRIGIATGLFGAFTTFSTFSKEVACFIYSGDYMMALYYFGAMLLFGFAATMLGIIIAREIESKRML